MLMFNLFDGTSTIACKAFLDKEKFEKVKSRISKAKNNTLLSIVFFVLVFKNDVISNTNLPSDSRKAPLFHQTSF